jgi:hypothetical protein
MVDRHLQLVGPGFPPPPAIGVLAATELRHIDSSGRLYDHDTEQVILACPDLSSPVTSYTHTFGKELAPVESLVMMRRSTTASNVYSYDEHLDAIDITFESPLEPGQTREIGLITTRNPINRRAISYRYAVGAIVMEHLSLSVSFITNGLPARLWQAEWESMALGGSAMSLQEVELPSDSSSHDFISELEMNDVQPGRVLGFYWSWSKNSPHPPERGTSLRTSTAQEELPKAA